VLRIEDLDVVRCRPAFVKAAVEDLLWFGLQWQEGPDIGGAFAPYLQSERMQCYRDALAELQQRGWVYPCRCSRQDVLRALHAPHQGDDEPIYPGTCRPAVHGSSPASLPPAQTHLERINWRFRVPDGETAEFVDQRYGPQKFTAGVDFGDFVVWRHDDIPAYHLAVVVDDAAMQITEVVRGADLLASTARQLLLYRALDLAVPEFAHCPLVTDNTGQRLAKRTEALSLQSLRQAGAIPSELRRGW
jgi:glutamyl/glutaminyl-tRNA synthetase